jgi:hypothetical protein
MIVGVIRSSVLQQKARENKVDDIEEASPRIRLAIYKSTIADLEDYLDTGDLGKLTAKALGVIKDDILEMIRGFRSLNGKITVGTVTSFEGLLESLRDSRENVQDALDFFKDKKRSEGRAKLREARTNLAEVLNLLEPLRRSRKLL